MNHEQHSKSLHRFGHYLGTIAANATAEDNTTTAADFAIPAGSLLGFQADEDCYISSEFDADDITASNSRKILADEYFTLSLWSEENKVAMLPVTGAVNLAVFLHEPRNTGA